MQQLDLNDFGTPNKSGLLKFLGYCQQNARARNHAILATISLPSEYLDPLAVLQTVNDSKNEHCYFEQASKHQGVACAEPVMLFEGAGASRFVDLKAFAQDCFDHCIFVGQSSVPWAGPHFFVEASFESELEHIDFVPPLLAMIPRWQVGWKGNEFSATANILVNVDDDLNALIEPIWRAHKRFSSFDFESDSIVEETGRARVEDVKILDQWKSESDYQSAVKSVLEAIASGEIEKAVISRELNLESEVPFEPLEILNLLRSRYPDCFTFSFQNNKGTSIIGATPEKLIRVKNGKFSTEALAGSIQRGQNARQDAHFTKQLLGSSKDRNEHGLVLKFIEEELQKLGLEAEFAEIPEILQLSNIQHLRVPLKGKMPEHMHLLDLVDALHPTPALGGYPSPQALKCIKQIEKKERGAYAGLTGWFNGNGDGEMAVNIRCAKVSEKRATLYAGAGIVSDSDVNAELKETDLKLTSMLPIFINMDDN